MVMTYSGYLQKNDPLYRFFRSEIQPEAGLTGDRDYRVFKMMASNSVYLYEDTKTGRRFIGKFYHHPFYTDRAAAHASMENEYANLNFLRNHVFRGSEYHYIAKPLGKSPELNEFLLEEYCYGESLSTIIMRSIRSSNPGLLYGKLTALAYFLSRFHNRTAAKDTAVHFSDVTEYASGLIHTLFHHGWISEHRRNKFYELNGLWHSNPVMWQDRQVVVHGDATPENFLFGDGLHVISFDMERVHKADRVFDLGRLTAELAHFFMLYTGDRNHAEPFIGHFLWEYSCHFPDRMAAFRSITIRQPFYQGINFLRIARNSYFDHGYRQQLLNAASECLKGGLQ